MNRIFFVTLSRSDYATMCPIAKGAQEDGALDVTVVAGGSHMLARFGRSIDGVKKDFSGVKIVDFLREDDDSDAQVAAAYARAVDGFVKLFTAEAPDMVFIVGDRWEMIAVASAASLLRIPVAHHSGGDVTQGSADNQTRYVLSTLSHLHFVALPDHKLRLESLGEEPERVIVVGEPALNGLKDVVRAVPDIHGFLGLKKDEWFALATFHPTSYEVLKPEAQIDFFIKVLGMWDETTVLTAPNPDPASGSFYERLRTFSNDNPRVKMVENLGRDHYYAAMAAAQFMIGNSSSGLWEAPSFGLPVVNIGQRQDGRVRGPNVVDAAMNEKSVSDAIARVIAPDFRSGLAGLINPYVREDGVKIIVEALKAELPREELLAKRFMDPLGII